MDPQKLIKETVERIKTGTLTDFSPLIALFQYERKPMTLDGHFMFLPLFSVEYPKYLTLQCGRQVSKSFTLSETLILTTGMIESFNSLYIAPRYDQLKRFHNQVLAPMLKTSCITPLIMDKSGSDAIEMKTFINGNSLMLEHAFSSPDRTRGASGVSRVCCDESVTFDTKILVFHLTSAKTGVYYISDRPEIVPISEVKQGDIVLSFTADGCIYSPVVRDASYHGRRAIFKVTTQSGRILRCTADHRLHTNLGSMRLSEVIEYGCNGGNGSRASEVGWNQRVCSECDRGDSTGGWVDSAPRSSCKAPVTHRVVSQYKTESLPGIQSRTITRARYPSNIRSEERQLRSRLNCANLDRGYRDIFIACAVGVPYGGVCEDSDTGTVKAVDTSGGACIVVRRRWKPCQKPKRRKYLYKRLHQGRSPAIVRLVTRNVGDRVQRATGHPLKHWKTSTCTYDDGRGLYKTVEPRIQLVTGVDELQINAANTNLSGLRENIPETGAQSELFSQVSRSLLEGEVSYILRDTQGRTERVSQELLRAVSQQTPGGNSCEISKKVCGAVPGGAQGTESESSRVPEKTMGALSGKGTGALPAAKSESGGVGEVSRRAQSLQRVGQGGSGKVPESIGAATAVSSETGKQRKNSRTAALVVAALKDRASREVCRIPAEAHRESTKDARSCTFGKTTSGFVYDRIISIECVGEEDVYDIEVVGTHNYILANGMCSYNCQDINPDFMPVFESTTDASKFGVIQSTGTAKTSDTLLAMQFGRSSQCHWAIKCPHCSKWNIADIEEQIIKMIGKRGLSCAYCGKVLDPRTGGWLPKFPDRQFYHAGYHVPQIILPMHCENETKWKVLLHRQATWNTTQFKNEVLGVECDDSVKLLTRDDLIAASNPWPNTLATAVEKRKLFDTIFIGVDWSGGGGGFSRTAICALGHATGSRESHVLFLETLPHGLTPEEEADRVAHVYSMLKADMLAHDYTGAGFVRESVLLGRHPYLREHIYPLAYVFRTGKQLVQYQESGSRKSANVDKTRSLLLTFNSIRSKLLKLPNFNPADNNAPQLELLNIVERPQEFSKSNIKEVYLLQRAPGRYDDAAHAINIAFIAQCDLTEDWPDFSVDPKYEMTDSALHEITGQYEQAVAY